MLKIELLLAIIGKFPFDLIRRSLKKNFQTFCNHKFFSGLAILSVINGQDIACKFYVLRPAEYLMNSFLYLVCELPKASKLECLRIGNKLRPDKYEVDKCDHLTVNNRKGYFFCTGKTKLSSKSSVYKCTDSIWKSMDDSDTETPTCLSNKHI